MLRKATLIKIYYMAIIMVIVGSLLHSNVFGMFGLYSNILIPSGELLMSIGLFLFIRIILELIFLLGIVADFTEYFDEDDE